MRILVQIHTWNDADVIGAVIDAILRQTRAVEEILIVDNGSTDGTAELAYPAIVTVVRHALNLGTSGSVKTAIGYARAHGYDWLWVLDADSMPRPDALQLLAGVIETGDPDLTQEIGVATVPGSSFYSRNEDGRQFVRFAFCKKQSTLDDAAERLARLKAAV